jgi:PPOX class probable F420-dependent enzyme
VSIADEDGSAPLSDHVRALLDGTPIAFMTTMRPDGRMSTNPVSMLYDGKRLRVSTVRSRKKVRNLVADERVTLCVVQPGNLNRYVEIRGRGVVEPDVDRAFINEIARVYMGVDEYPFDAPGDERVVVTVIPEQVSAPLVPLADNPPYSRPDEAT